MSPPRAGLDDPDDPDDPDDGDDFEGPHTHLEDDEYEEFVGRTFGRDGQEKGDPPVAKVLLLVVLALLVLAVLALT